MKFSSRKILIVCAETFLYNILITRFKIRGHEVCLARSGKRGLAYLKKKQPDLVILDKFSIQLSSQSLYYKILEISKAPVITLTPKKSSVSTKNPKLDLNYYLLKPFSLKWVEFLCDPILLSVQPTKISNLKKGIVYFNNLIFDLTKEQVFKKGVDLKLTILEFRLLTLLIINIGKSLSRSTILVNVWGYIPEREIDTRLIDVHISRLRSKIEEIPSKPNFIITVRGTGYTFNPSQTLYPI